MLFCKEILYEYFSKVNMREENMREITQGEILELKKHYSIGIEAFKVRVIIIIIVSIVYLAWPVLLGDREPNFGEILFFVIVDLFFIGGLLLKLSAVWHVNDMQACTLQILGFKEVQQKISRYRWTTVYMVSVAVPTNNGFVNTTLRIINNKERIVKEQKTCTVYFYKGTPMLASN